MSRSRANRLVCAALLSSLCGFGDDSELDSIMRRGRESMAKQDYAAAASAFGRAARLAPEDGEVQLMLGLAWFGCDRLEDAVEPLEKSVRAMPADALPAQFLGRVLFEVGRLDEAKAALVKARELDPTDATTVNHLGAVYLKEGDTPTAIETFEQSLALDPEYGTAHFNLGVLLFLEGEAAGAETHLRRAVELNPRDSDAPLILGDLHSGLGEPRVARDWYEVAAERLPESNVATARAADANRDLCDLASAWRWQSLRLGVGDGDAGAWRDAHVLAVRRGDFAAARRALEKCVAIDPASLPDSKALADFLEDRGELAAARGAIEAALALTENDANLLRRLSRVCEMTDDPTAAKAMFDRLVGGDEPAPVALRCIAERMLNSDLEGIRNVELGHGLATALVERSRGEDAAALVLLAGYEARKGDAGKAAATYERAAALFDATAPAARLLRDRAAHARGDDLASPTRAR